MKFLKLILVISALVISTQLFAQGGHAGHTKNGHRKGGKPQHVGNGRVVRNRVVVKRSIYHPSRVVVYHPHWHRNYSYNRRWVYFPRYNFYWDNWRNQYLYWNGNVWYNQTQTPPIIINVNLEKEKHVELKKDEDDVDDIYKTNEKHKNENKVVE
jgi:hypothetical protein